MKKPLITVIGLFLMSVSLVVVAEKMHMHDDQANSNVVGLQLGEK